MENICSQITVAAFMQPLQYDLRSPAAKDNSITHAAVARSNLDAAITMRSAKTELQNTIELRATGSEIVAPKPDLDARANEKKTILKQFLKGFLEGTSLDYPDLPKDPSKIIQPLQEKSTLKKRLLFHAKKDCYFTQKKTLIFIKKRLLFFQAKHHHVYVCCMLKEKLDIM